MGTFNEYIEKLKNDEEFANKINTAFASEIEAGETDPDKILISTAEKFGYSVTEEEIKAFREQNKEAVSALSEEEMGKVAGGSWVALAVSTAITAFVSIYKAVK